MRDNDGFLISYWGKLRISLELSVLVFRMDRELCFYSWVVDFAAMHFLTKDSCLCIHIILCNFCFLWTTWKGKGEEGVCRSEWLRSRWEGIWLHNCVKNISLLHLFFVLLNLLWWLYSFFRTLEWFLQKTLAIQTMSAFLSVIFIIFLCSFEWQ